MEFKNLIGIAYRSSNADQFLNIVEKYLNKTNYFSNTTSICNNEEIHATVCFSDTKLVQSCTQKILQQIYNENLNNYEEIIKSVKEGLINLNKELTEAFVKDTTNEIDPFC